MPLSPQDQQELQELRRLDQLESKYGQQAPGAAPVDELQQQSDAYKKAQAGKPFSQHMKEMVFGNPDAHLVQGNPPIAIPAAAAPAAMGKLAEFLKGSLGTRLAAQGTAGAATGGLMTPGGDDSVNLPQRGHNALVGLALGLGGGMAAEGISAGAGLGRRGVDSVARRAARFTPKQAGAYTADPHGVADMAAMIDDESQLPELQNQAKEAINNSRRNIKGEGLKKAAELRQLLTGKQVNVNPQELMGSATEADQALLAARPNGGMGGTPRNLPMDAEVLNSQVKRPLQAAAQYRPGTVLDPVQEAKVADAAKKAAIARQAIEGVDPGVAPLNQSMQEGKLLQESLRKGAKTNPLSYVSTESPDKVAMLARAEAAGGGGIREFGNKYGAAKMMSMKDIDDSLTRMAVKQGGRAALRTTSGLSNATQGAGPVSLQSILQSIFSRSNPPTE